MKRTKAKIQRIKTLNGKKYILYPTGFTTKKAAETIAKTLKKHPKIKGARITTKTINKKKVYLIYIR